ncbi:MAG TPA: malectin domain-containing carbohydrate-binding protein [Candidatus Acidoferrum sp.]|nr:malectin domain-containing carbohydrate-binding protein [Candidatus Acidoferrum sp.]
MKNFLFVFSLLAAASIPAAAQTQAPIRVDCGGSGYTDTKGQLWQGDTGYSGGRTATTNIAVAGTTDPQLFQSNRYVGPNSKTLAYSFPAASGLYHVNLYFAETNSTLQRVGARVFNVRIEGDVIFPNLDIYAAAGANSAMVKSADVMVSDGKIAIELDNVVQSAEISAIEITQTISMPPLKLTFIYPDGSAVAGSLNYQISPVATAGTTTSATSLNGSQPLVSGQATCLLLASPQLLGLAGTLNVNLNLTDTAGRVLWQIAMTLNPSTANFLSVQSSTLQVVVQKP